MFKKENFFLESKFEFLIKTGVQTVLELPKVLVFFLVSPKFHINNFQKIISYIHVMKNVSLYFWGAVKIINSYALLCFLL